MTMTREQADKLIELIDAKIAEAVTRHDDKGLSDFIRGIALGLEKELRALCQSTEDNDGDDGGD